MTAPDFTLIVPAYNAAATLDAALATIERQTETSWEAVVVDDGATDDTGAIADRWADGERRRVIHQPNAGLPAARNAALAVARGRWIALLDSDDWLMPTYLERMRWLLEQSPGAGLAFCDAWIWDQTRRRVARRTASGPYRPAAMPETPEETFRALLRGNFVYGAASMPREVAESVGGFDESLRAAEDWQAWLRIAGSGRAFAQTPDCLAVYRHSPGQMSKDPQRMLQGRLAALRAVGSWPGLQPALMPDLQAAIARAEHALATLRAPGPQQRARALARAAIGPVRPVRDFRLRAPRELAAAFPELARR